MPFLEAGALVGGAGRAVRPGVVVHGVRRVRHVLGPVDVAHARAGGAGVAVAAAVGGPESGADARAVGGQGRRPVAVGLARAPVRSPAVAVVAVQAVAILVEGYPLDLTRVVAAAAGAVEVDRRAVPVGVAGEVDVDVGGELLAQPDVAQQPAAADLLGAVHMVELGAGGVGVAQAADARGRAVGPGRGAEGDVADAVGGERDRAAGVADPHVLAVEHRGHDPANVVVDAGRVGEAARGDVGERHRHNLLDAEELGAAGHLGIVVGVY